MPSKKPIKMIPNKTSESLTKEVTREELYMLIKGFDGVKAPFSPLSRKLFAIYKLNRDVYEEVDKFKKEYDAKLEEYNTQIGEIAQKYGDKDESGQLKSKFKHDGSVSWSFTTKEGEVGMAKFKTLREEYKDWLDYALPDSEFKKFIKEPVTLQYIEIIKTELTKLTAKNIIDLILILPSEIAEKDLPEDMIFEQMRVLSETVVIK